MKGGEFKGDFAKLCRRHGIGQEFTTVDSAKFNEVAKRYIAMVESAAGMATQVQAKPLFRGSKFHLVADCGLYVTIGRAVHSTVQQQVLMWGLSRRSKYVLVRYRRARSLPSSQGT